MICSFKIGENLVVEVLEMVNSEYRNYTYVIIDSKIKRAIVIDPAWEIDKILNILNKDSLVLEAILLTHSHYDHVNLVEPLVALFNCEVYMSESEIDYYHYECTNLSICQNTIKCLDRNINVILTPGHTVGGVCFLIENCLFTGDTVFMESCGICNVEGGSYNDMYHSLRLLHDSIEDDTRIFPGHKYKNELGGAFREVKKGFIFNFTDENTFVKCRKILDKQAYINQLLKKEP